jgi:hypothetical protein
MYTSVSDKLNSEVKKTIPKRKHSLSFKAEGIKLPARTTVAKAAAQLSISSLQIYDWGKTMMSDFTDVEKKYT